MFVLAKNAEPKILMGMLSYEADLDTLDKVNREIEWYDHEPQRELLLWHDEETDSFPTCIGLDTVFDTVLLRRVIFSPSVNHIEQVSLGAAMLHDLALRFPDQTVLGTIATQRFINEWRS